MKHDNIPVIDLAPLLDGSDPESVAQAIHRASREIGFIYAANHGIADDVTASARNAALEFFRLPHDIKDAIRVNEYHRGFLGRGGAKMQDDAKADLKESFIWGLEASQDGNLPPCPLRGPNQWPASHAGLKPAATAYFEDAHSVAKALMRAFAIGLGLPEDQLLRGHDRPMSRASMVYYPPQSGETADGRFGVGPHTDFGVLTVLCQDNTGGLEVQGLDGNWIEAPPIDGTLVINVGDLLARWSNDQYRSTPHRVINRSGRERLSLVLAYDPDFDTLIDPAETVQTGMTPKYDAITCGDYLVARFARAFAYRKKDAVI